MISCPLLWVAKRVPVRCTVTCQVAPRPQASRGGSYLLFPTPVGLWYRFVNEVRGLRNQLSPRLPKQGFSGSHMGCLRHEEGGWEAGGGGLEGGSRSKKVGFFPLINQLTPAHSCCSWLAGLKINSESPMLLLTSTSCVGIGHFSSVFLAEGRKQHEGVKEKSEERVNLLCYQVLNP